MAGHRGHRECNNSRQETDQTLLTTTKALTKTTHCAFRAKKVEGHDQKEKFTALGAGSVPPLLRQTGATTFKFVPAPLIMIIINIFNAA